MRSVNHSLVHHQFGDIGQIGELARDWDLDFRQVQAGELSATLLQCAQPGGQFAWANFSHCVLQNGISPAAGRTFALLDHATPLEWCGRAVTRDDLMAFDPSGAFDSLSGPGFSVFTLTLPERAWQRGMHHRLQRDARDGPRQPDVLQARTPLVQMLRNRLREYRRLLSDQTGSGHEAARVLNRCIDALFAVIAHGTSSPDRQAGSTRARAVRRAADFIRSRGGASITMEELCAVTGASERTLQYAFREHTGQTPKAFIRSYRLDRIRHELRMADGEPISAVARRWGFRHMGQFARYYRRQFGERPSDT